MNVTAWASGLEVTGDGTGIVSHAGVGLVRRLSDKTGLTGGLSQALFSGRLLHHDRGRVLADISCGSRTVPARSAISGCLLIRGRRSGRSRCGSGGPCVGSGTTGFIVDGIRPGRTPIRTEILKPVTNQE